MFGYNKSVVEIAINPNFNIHKIHTELYFNILQKDISYNIVDLYHIFEGDNPDDKIPNN